MSNLLIKETALGVEKIFPKNYILNLVDKESGKTLLLILNSFNMLFLNYIGNKADTRKQVPTMLRKLGLWITYVVGKTTVTEWYNSQAIDDTTWGASTYWVQGSNMLVGDVAISANGTWVINGLDTGISPKGDKGETPLIRVKDNLLLVSYDNGTTYNNLTNTPIYTKFRFNSLTNTYLVSYDLGGTWQDISDEKVYHKFRYNNTTNTYLESIDFGKTWSNISAEKVYYLFRYNAETNTHLVSTDLGLNWTDVSSNKVYYLFRTGDNRLLVSTDLGTTWKNCSEPIAAWFRWADTSGTGNVGKVLISRDNKTWSDLSPTITNNLYIKGYVSTVGDLPTSSAAIGDIYMVGPTYDESDTAHDYPHYRMWVKLSSGWIDNGEFTNAGPVGTNNIIDKAVTLNKLSTDTQAGIIYDVSAHNNGTVFESISALLSSSNLSTLIPASVRYGGMSIRFIQGSELNSDNKYVQYLYHGTSIAVADFTNTTNWEKTNLEEEIRQLCQEVFGEKVLNWSNGYINTSGLINSSTASKFTQPFLLKAGESVTVGTNNTNVCIIGETTVNNLTVGDTITPIQTSPGTPGFVNYTYTAQADIMIVICVKWSDYTLSFNDPESIVGQIKQIEKSMAPDFTAYSQINNIISELYIDGFVTGMKFYIFTYTSNGLLTIVIKDTNDNTIVFANDKAVSANTPIFLSKNGINLYVILSGQTQTVFPTNTTINNCVADLKFSPSILTYILNQQHQGISTLENVKAAYPICVSRFNRGSIPNADHNACWISISRRYTSTKDGVVNFANKINANITNKFFDLYSIGTIDRGESYVAYVNDYTDPSTFWVLSTSDAIFMPMIVGAVNNIDGDNTTEKWFTGGAHAYGNESDGASPTIREISCDVLVDGKPVSIGTTGVRGNQCDIYLVENIQGWNTCKQDGTGREIVQRRTHIIVTNDNVEINVEIKALEEVVFDGPLYATGIGTNNADGFRLIGSESRKGIYTGEVTPANDDNEINAFRYIKSPYIFDTIYDICYGLKNKYVTSMANLFASNAGKSYFRAIQSGTSLTLLQNESIFYRTMLQLSENK